MLNKGDKCPDFTLPDQNNKNVSLNDFKGQKLLIYFYPKANTPGCTQQSCAVRDAKEDFSSLKLNAIGISPDTPDKQKKFESGHNLNFPLLCDTDHTVSEAFGVWQEKNMYGRKYMGIVRSSFLVDENGIIIETWYKVKPKETVPKALEALKSLR
jgi:thioredoxin-dependent peroxiredoxin